MLRGKLNAYAIDWERGGEDALRGEVDAERRTHNHEDTFVRLADPANNTQLIEVPRELQPLRLASTGAQSRPLRTSAGWNFRPATRMSGSRLPFAISPMARCCRLARARTSAMTSWSEWSELSRSSFFQSCFWGWPAASFLLVAPYVPFSDLTNTLRPIVETGSLKDRAPIRPEGNELDHLAALFNRALERITLLIDGMRDSLDNVAHDLRTPMTRLRATAELALQAGDAT